MSPYAWWVYPFQAVATLTPPGHIDIIHRVPLYTVDTVDESLNWQENQIMG